MSGGVAVRERPILFSGPMVRAILEGRKTVTRRVVNITHRTPGLAAALLPPVGIAPRPRVAAELCPYGQPGDRLWVRETFACNFGRVVAYRADGECGAWIGDGAGGQYWLRHGGIIEVPGSKGPSFGLGKYGGRWRPSIHMPRWASRITLEITDVRVERLQEITEEEARAEGRTLQDFGAGGPGYFPHTWDELNASRGYGWDTNPWVWVVAFRPLPASEEPSSTSDQP